MYKKVNLNIAMILQFIGNRIELLQELEVSRAVIKNVSNAEEVVCR